MRCFDDRLIVYSSNGINNKYNTILHGIFILPKGIISEVDVAEPLARSLPTKLSMFERAHFPYNFTADNGLQG